MVTFGLLNAIAAPEWEHAIEVPLDLLVIIAAIGAIAYVDWHHWNWIIRVASFLKQLASWSSIVCGFGVMKLRGIAPSTPLPKRPSWQKMAQRAGMSGSSF